MYKAHRQWVPVVVRDGGMRYSQLESERCYEGDVLVPHFA